MNQRARLHFGDLTLDIDTRQLLRGGEVVALSPKAFQLVTILVERRPRAISKTELTEVLWPNTYVAETNLASLIAEIRQAIRDSAQNPRFIRTVHRFGYAFSGTATDDGSSSGQRKPRRGTGMLVDLRYQAGSAGRGGERHRTRARGGRLAGFRHGVATPRARHDRRAFGDGRGSRQQEWHLCQG